MKNLEKIADWCLKIDNIEKKEIQNFHGPVLKIEIKDNTPNILSCEYLQDGTVEERHQSIFNLVSETCKNHKVDDCIFLYSTEDRSDFKVPEFVFTHARLRDTRNLIAPCFTFDAYPEGERTILVPYTETYKKITDSVIRWEHKENYCCFVGHIGSNNNRDFNTDLSLNHTKILLFNQQASSKDFISRNELSRYRYLLHLNGNGGAYASRFKYLLGNGSLVFYNYNSGPVSNFWEEWWMMPDFFIDKVHYISCVNKIDFKNKIDSLKEDDAKNIANNAHSFFKEELNPKKVTSFFSILLNKYAKKIK